LVLGLLPDQTSLDRQQRGLGAIGDAELGEQVTDVSLDRLL
jgi:hypothetical protein